MNTKKNIHREKAKAIRRSLNTKLISTAIVNNIVQWDKYKKARIIMLFYPIGSEINLLKLLDDTTKQFVFPVVNGNNMYPVFYTKKQGFKAGAYNINEPIGNIADINDIDLILMPALAVDKQGYRLGYGKGYYDRFLENTSIKAIKVIPISSTLVFDKIPVENHDKRADYVITENKILETALFKMVCTTNINNIT